MWIKVILSFTVSMIALWLWVVPVVTESDSRENLPKIRGASLVNPHQPIDSSQMAEISRVNADWVAVIPFAFSRLDDPGVYFDHERQWWGERVAGAAALIQLAHDQGFKVMLKPHVWMREGWIGDYELKTEEEWRQWETNYTAYLMRFANLADSLDVAMLCIGTELKKTEVTRAAFWSMLAKEVRTVYSGKLTYAANWDHYDQITFWGELDYIGVNAYFPLAESEAMRNPKQIIAAWEPIKAKLKETSVRFKRPILLTEYGYASCAGALVKPWEESGTETDFEMQSLGYQCLYEALWKEKWMAGGFFWKWHFSLDPKWESRARFTPQNKPVESVITKWYGASAP